MESLADRISILSQLHEREMKGKDEEVKFPCVSAYEAIMFSTALRVSTVALY